MSKMSSVRKKSYTELSKISRFMIKNDNYGIMWEK